MEQKQTLPNANTVFVLGLLSLVFCWSVAGLVLGIIALTKSATSYKLLKEGRDQYVDANMFTSGRTMAIIGLSISGAVILIESIAIGMVGFFSILNIDRIFDTML